MHLERQKARCYKLAKQNSEEVVVIRNYFYDKMGILNLHIVLLIQKPFKDSHSSDPQSYHLFYRPPLELDKK